MIIVSEYRYLKNYISRCRGIQVSDFVVFYLQFGTLLIIIYTVPYILHHYTHIYTYIIIEEKFTYNNHDFP